MIEKGWKFNLEISSTTWDTLHNAIKLALHNASHAKSYKDLKMMWGESYTSYKGPIVSEIRARVTSPVEEQIKELRLEADRLEAELEGKK